MTNEEVLHIAMKQSALELNCSPADFKAGKPKVVISKEVSGCRKYYKLPFYCNLVSYGDNVVASVNEEIADIVNAYIHKYPTEHCFETPNLHILNDALEEKGMRICFMAEYFLPDCKRLKELPCEYEIRILEPNDFEAYYIDDWSNALCKRRKNLDVLAAGAFHDGKLVGLAGCSADCDDMWQIGVDVLSEYRRRGIASAITSRLALEIMNRGKVPFYCAVWPNLGSVRNAIRSGFRPAWVEMAAKSKETVAKMNQ